MEFTSSLMIVLIFAILHFVTIEAQSYATSSSGHSSHYGSSYGYPYATSDTPAGSRYASHTSFNPRKTPFETYSKDDPLMGRRIVCLYNNANYYKSGLEPKDLDAHLCTHINYEFAKLDPKTYEMVPSEPDIDIDQNFYDDTVGLKKLNPSLKVMLSLGGWKDSTKKYSELVASPELVKHFITEAVYFLRMHGFDGLDVAWEYPNCWQGELGVRPADKDNFTVFLQELRKALDAENKILSISVTAIKREIEAGYDGPAVAKAVHYVNVMTYDMHGPWERKTGHHTQFDKKAGDADPSLNSKSAMEIWANNGFSKMQLNLGIATYAKTFTLVNPANHEFGAPARGPGAPGALSNNGGSLCYREICQYLNAVNWTEGEDKAVGFYAYSGDQWAAYDPPLMVVRKIKWIAESGYGGVLIKDFSCDDFEGICLSMKFPLISMIRMEFISKMRKLSRLNRH
ncbi:probable chitinase 10 [Argiope bruennichi]|nr:probable chitinase 10 [Argiope bruennichi]